MELPVTYVETCRQALDVIDQMLVGMPEGQAKNLWDVLTALRGPDNQRKDGEVKFSTTAIIRKTAFPKTAVVLWGDLPSCSAVMCTVANDSEERLKKRVSIVRGHFQQHAQDAFWALELKWTRLNPPTLNPVKESGKLAKE